MFLFDTRTAAEIRQDQLEDERNAAAKIATPVPWNPKMKFESVLRIKGETYKQPSLFDVTPSQANERNPNGAWESDSSKFAISPDGRWGYRERILEAGGVLPIRSGNKRGAIAFDSDVLIPMLHRGSRNEDWEQFWETHPWMSFTPSEHFTLRPGVRIARGHVVVAGLGMGYQLEEVCKKRSVTRVTLVEESEELVKWILPRVQVHGKTIEVIIGNACEIVPPMTCDVALIDIFPNYGGNDYRWWRGCRNKYTGKSGEKGKVWIWGA